VLVLVADKDPHDLDLAVATLKARDMDVVVASDGDECVRLAVEHLPEVVILGASLGSRGGLGVSRDLKTMAAAGELPEPKILVLIERDADAWLAGWSMCDAYLTKPVEASELDALVRELAAGRERPAV
jgi:DNA-binding response OmpR family regulator